LGWLRITLKQTVPLNWRFNAALCLVAPFLGQICLFDAKVIQFDSHSY